MLFESFVKYQVYFICFCNTSITINILDAIPVAAYPIKNIPWKLVAKELNHERIPLDYIRRWPAILRIVSILVHIIISYDL